ncbi:MAG TPA: CBS domain-containing protein [Dehalococcoidia bacterium]|nr:CBS domain-containing protein [Dehalococcoidia bacterium]
MAAEANTVRGTFQTDPISALGLQSPVSIASSATVGQALAAVQKEGQGYVLVLDNGKPVGIMSEREVVMRIVARDVKYDANVMEYVSPVTRTLTNRNTIAEAIALMQESIDNIPVVDDTGRAVACVRQLDIIRFLAEAFPEQVLNLPPRPHQAMPRPEGG